MNLPLAARHAGAVAACVAGYPLLGEAALALELFHPLFPAPAVRDVAVLHATMPPGLDLAQALAWGACASSPRCPLAIAAYAFAPLALLWGGLALSGARPRTGGLALALLPVCAALTGAVALLVASPLAETPAVFTYAERWRYLPSISAVVHAGYLCAGALAAPHAAALASPWLRRR